MLGAYILSPLEEASRDPRQNAGFIITWINSNQESRVTSYSVRNSVHSASTEPPSPTTLPRKPSLPPQIQTWSVPRKNTATLSRLLINPSLASSGTGEKTFAAFKALPIDPARIRRGSSTGSGPYSETSEEVAGASNCRDVVDRIVDSIHRACQEVGGGRGNFVTNEDVVRQVHLPPWIWAAAHCY